MYVSDELVFSELQKTGCSHIRRVLETHFDGHKAGKHNAPPLWVMNDARLKIGSVRDPWDWYVSLFTYGCGQHGQLWHTTTQRDFSRLGWGRYPLRALRNYANLLKMDTEGWARLYRDPSDVGAFREWLARTQDPAWFMDIQEELSFHPAARVYGLMTTRFIKVFCRRSRQLLERRGLTTAQIDDACFVDIFVRNEDMEVGLASIFAQLGRPELDADNLRALERTNTSNRTRDWRRFYDDASRDLVARRESYLINRFGYAAPPRLGDDP